MHRSRPTLRRNHVTSCKQVGINVRDEARPTVNSNFVLQGKSHGLSLDGEARGYYSNNTFSQNEKVGIMVIGSAAPTCSFNLVELAGVRECLAVKVLKHGTDMILT